MKLFFLYASLSLLAHPLAAEVFTFDSAEKWQTWQLPQGLVQLGPSGHLELVKFRKDIDPVRNASDFFPRYDGAESRAGRHLPGWVQPKATPPISSTAIITPSGSPT